MRGGAICAVALASATQLHADELAIHALILDLSNHRLSPVFRPDEAMGAAIDGAQAGDIDRLLTPKNIAAMKGAGLRPLTYRLRTELGIEAWHWNPVGRWSDPAHSQGYWTSSDTLGTPIGLSWGYRLPRRGDTVDNANNDDYSRLTDGDRSTFWKSNPYLDPSVLRDGEEHPQWLMLRFDASRPVDAILLDWADPYATRFDVQYWVGASDYDPAGKWVTFPHGRVEGGRGGRQLIRLADQPVAARFVRVLLHTGSETATAGSTDWRDRKGFAVREVSFGLQRSDSGLDDAVIHAPSHDGQTFAHVSSTDPWHRASDRDPNLEQAGIDRIFKSGLGFGLPIMMPTGLLFDTPDNITAELRYLKKRHYPVRQVELGEEPDGQYGSPADYGALYLAAVARLRRIAPHIHFGGPSLQSAFTETWMLPDASRSWNRGFVDYLKRRGQVRNLGFLSFEYYPFDDICGDIHAKLIQQDHLLGQVMRRFAEDGVPIDTPKIISEYGFSAYSGRAMSEMPSALLMASIVGDWLSMGGASAYMFGYGPNVPINQHQPCAGYGNMMPFTADSDGQADKPMPSYFTARLLSQIWAMPGHDIHHLVPAHLLEMPGNEVKAFAVRGPKGRLGVLLVNRSADRSFRVALMRKNAGGETSAIHGPARIYSYGPEQYMWLDDGPASRPLRSGPPKEMDIKDGAIRVTIPPDTIKIVVKGR